MTNTCTDKEPTIAPRRAILHLLNTSIRRNSLGSGHAKAKRSWTHRKDISGSTTLPVYTVDTV